MAMWQNMKHTKTETHEIDDALLRVEDACNRLGSSAARLLADILEDAKGRKGDRIAERHARSLACSWLAQALDKAETQRVADLYGLRDGAIKAAILASAIMRDDWRGSKTKLRLALFAARHAHDNAFSRMMERNRS